MAEYEFGNMWNGYKHSDAFCITTNSFIRNDGSLVMCRGIAKVADEVLDVDQKFGSRIEEKCGDLGFYGVLPLDPDNSRLVAFQVKKHFKDNSPLDLVEKSTKILGDVAHKHDWKRFDLNFPAIGNGGRDIEDVKPILEEHLPNNVHIWRPKHAKN